MARHWLHELTAGLAQLDASSMRRSLRAADHRGPWIVTADGRTLLNLGSNDYLGIAEHPRLRDAVIAAAECHGVGSGASRLAGGTLGVHAQLESRFARFKHAEAALLCPTGYMANHAALTSLASEGDLVCLDKLNHASLLDAARASGAQCRVYPHLNLDKLERLLARHHNATRDHKFSDSETRKQESEVRRPRRFIATDSVFSMDGDVADLPAVCDLAERYDAVVVVDEAHGTGVLGDSGAGLCEAQGVSGRVDVVVSTASKALGSLGGVITARQVVIDTIVNRARSFIFTTAAPPTQAAAIAAALDVIESEPGRRHRLTQLAERVTSTLRSDARTAGLVPGSEHSPLTPIIPLVVHSPERALALAQHLESQGYYAPAIRPPTVAPNACRVRVSLRADLSDEQVDGFLAAVCAWA